MGTLLALFIVISLNLAPEGARTVTIDSFVVEGVGIHSEATTFVLTRDPDGTWQLNDAHGDPWYVVAVAGPVITISADGVDNEVDLGAALGLPAEEWWTADSVEPPGFSALLLQHLADGLNIDLEGMRAAEARW